MLMLPLFNCFVRLKCNSLFFLQKKKGILHISEIQNPNLVKPKNMKARAADVSGMFVLVYDFI